MKNALNPKYMHNIHDKIKNSLTFTSTDNELSVDAKVLIDSNKENIETELFITQKYIILSFTGIFSGHIFIIWLFITNSVGMVLFDILVNGLCLCFMGSIYNKYYRKLCCTSIICFSIIDECLRQRKLINLSQLKLDNLDDDYKVNDALSDTELEPIKGKSNNIN